MPRLAARRDPVGRAIAQALKATARGRTTREEDAWIERIEQRRRELAAEQSVTTPSFDPDPAKPRPWWGVREPVPVGAAASLMSLPPVWCLLLMRLIRELRPQACLELGTGFGISGAYQAAALELNRAGELITLEGAPEWAKLAQDGFSTLGLERVRTLVGPIDETFGQAAGAQPIDFAFVDAEHTEEAILGALEMLLPHLSDDAVIAFDDIDIYSGTKRAWSKIKRHPRVSATVGVRCLGIVVVSGSAV